MSDDNKTDWSNLKTVHADRFIETKKTVFDLNNLHPEAQNRLHMLGFLTTNADGEEQEVSDDQINTILRKTMQNEDPSILADKYMMKHGLYEFFKDLTAKVVLNRPADPVGFMITDLEKQLNDKPTN